MRVVHLVPALFGPNGVVGGAERYAFELARYMADMVPTRLVTFGDRAGRERVGKLDVVCLGPAWYLRGIRCNPLHSGVFGQLGWPHVVHCHQRYWVNASVAAGLCRLTGRRAFVSDLGGGGMDISTYFPGVQRFYHGFLHISQYSQQISGQDGEPRSQVIYGGVDVLRFSPDPSVPRERLVVYAGRLMPHKGVDDLVAALPDGLVLELIGRAYDRRFFLDLQRLAEGKAVVFRHDCDDAELVRAYQRAMCVVLPSVYQDRYGNKSLVPELLGQTLIEGMACGTPAICTAVASMPEVVADGETGFVVPPNDPVALRAKLEWLRDHPAEIERLGAVGRQRVLEKFTWPTVVSQCLRAYSSG